LNRQRRRQREKQRKKRSAASGGSAPDLLQAREHRKEGRFLEALDIGRAILDREPDNSETLNFLGRLSLELKKADMARSFFERAVEAEPDNVPYRVDLIGSMLLLGELDMAAMALRDVRNLDDDAGILARRMDELESMSRQVISENEKSPAAHFALGEVLKARGDLEGALVSHRRALRYNSQYAEADTGQSIALLNEGNLKEGWLEFEWRKSLGSFGPFTEIVWNGEDASGKTILVWGEQGIGDQILFASCLPDIIRDAGLVILEVDKRLVSLFQRSFPKAIVHGERQFTATGTGGWDDFSWLDAFPQVDYFTPEGSLPRFYRSHFEDFPQHDGFLFPDAGRAAVWRQRVDGIGDGLKIGVAWRSLFMTDDRAEKYPPLDCWVPLFRTPGLSFVSVQANIDQAEKADIEERFGIVLETFDDIDLKDDLDDTVALLSALDGIVSADTYLPMFAGALGKPVWRITRADKTEDWSFFGADRYLWFPSMTVHFAITEGDLTSVFESIAKDINGLPEKD